MGTLSNKYFNAQAVEDALDKGVAAYDSMGQIELVYNGTDIRFNNEVVNFQQIVDYITTDTRFCYMVYNNRVLLTSDMQLTGGTRYVFFETSTTDSGLSKNTVVKVYSAGGTTISSISHSTIANENFSNKVSTIADNDKNSTVHYPSNKAVTEITDGIRGDLNNKIDSITESGIDNLIDINTLHPNNSSTTMVINPDKTINVSGTGANRRLETTVNLSAGKTYFFHLKVDYISGNSQLRFNGYNSGTAVFTGATIAQNLGETEINQIITLSGNVNTIRIYITTATSTETVAKISEIMIVESSVPIPYIEFTAKDSVARNALNRLDSRVSQLENDSTKYPEHEATLIEAINSTRDSNCILFALSTDNHYNSFDWKDKKQVEYANGIESIANKLNVDFIVNLGDISEGYNDYLAVNQYKQQYVNSDRIAEMVNAFTKNDIPFIYTAGHHECYPINENNIASQVIESGSEFVQNRAFSSAELKEMTYGTGTYARFKKTTHRQGYRKFYETIVDIPDVNSDTSTLSETKGSSLTYYYDVTKGNNTIRFLVVDATHFTGAGYHPDTVSFVSTALTDARTKGYKVVIFSHIPLRYESYFENGVNAINEESYINAIKSSGADILAYIHGHIHADNIVTPETTKGSTVPYSDLTFPMISTSCQKIYGTTTATMIGNAVSYGTRTIDTYAEYCADFVLLHCDTGVLEYYRFGAGDNGTYPTRTIN